MGCRPPETYANPRDVGELLEPFRSRIWTLLGDAPRRALIPVSLYRTPFQQWLLRHERCPGRECDPGCIGRPRTALPGRSKHGKRLAADLGGRDLPWAIENAARYGLSLPVAGEDWHFELGGAPSVPIRRYVPAADRPWIGVRPGDTDETVFARGGRDNEVSEIQLRLARLAELWNAPELSPGPIDGNAGPKVAAAVIAFHERILRLQELTGQERWPAPDALVGHRKIAMLRWWTP